MLISIIFTFLLGLGTWLYGGWLHKNSLYYDQDIPRFPLFLENMLAKRGKHLSYRGLGLQLSAFVFWSFILLIGQIIDYEALLNLLFIWCFAALFLVIIANWRRWFSK